MRSAMTKAKVCSDVSELSLLFEVSQILDRSVDLRDDLGPVLKAMAQHMGMLRGTITLVEHESGELFIAAAHGRLSGAELERGRYKLREGVVETGRAMAIPQVSKEPMFLNRTRALDLDKESISYICVPIKMETAVIGTLSADRLFSKEVSIEEDLRLMTILASLIAQAVWLRQQAQAERDMLLEENTRLQHELKDRFQPTNMIGRSNVIRDVFDLISQVAKSDATVLIRGESGVGKELVAHAIHYNSSRASKAFIRVNCAALTESVIESELFGHEKGSFTSALQQRQGRFELANEGTIFLDEIGDLSAATQIRLLRVLQEREFERVGGSDTIKVDVRVVAATNRDLESLISESAGGVAPGEHTFRQDLYYRVNVFPIHLPPLRERRTDILELANYFVEKYSKRNHKYVRRISTPAIDMLMNYHWPGNVRELENCIERAVLITDDDVVHGHHLPPTLQTAEASNTPMTGTLEETLYRVEGEMVVEALKKSFGNKAEAARELGITERLMGLRVNKFGLTPRDYRAQ